MDPFNEVKEDAWATIGILEQLVASRGDHVEFNNNYEEFEEIQRDLQQAIKISEQNPERYGGRSVIQARQRELQQLASKASELKASFTGTKPPTIANNTRGTASPSPDGTSDRHKPREVTTMSNRISQDENPFSLQTQEQLTQQDGQLDSIHETMRNLNKQASLMGSELEDQAFMLDELDNDLDNVENKLQRGLKRVNVFLERNKERASNCCIGILAVALCILLVLVIAL